MVGPQTADPCQVLRRRAPAGSQIPSPQRAGQSRALRRRAPAGPSGGIPGRALKRRAPTGPSDGGPRASPHHEGRALLIVSDTDTMNTK